MGSTTGMRSKSSSNFSPDLAKPGLLMRYLRPSNTIHWLSQTILSFGLWDFELLTGGYSSCWSRRSLHSWFAGCLARSHTCFDFVSHECRFQEWTPSKWCATRSSQLRWGSHSASLTEKPAIGPSPRGTPGPLWRGLSLCRFYRCRQEFAIFSIHTRRLLKTLRWLTRTTSSRIWRARNLAYVFLECTNILSTVSHACSCSLNWFRI